MEWRYELCPADRYRTERSVLMKTRTHRKNGLSGTDKEIQLGMSITISQPLSLPLPALPCHWLVVFMVIIIPRQGRLAQVQ